MFNKNKAVIKTALMMTALVGLSGCSGITTGSDSLMRPPRATGDKAAIQDIISAEAGGSYTLKYPQKGENRSAITLRNENTDDEYAIALYATENETKLNVSVITYSAAENVWKCIGTYTNMGSGVDRILFEDINGDKTDDVIIGWTSYNSSQKNLTAYSFKEDEVYEMVMDETYDELIVTDLTADMSDDLLLLSLSTQEKASTATLLQYSEPDKRPVGKYSLELDSDVIAFSNIVAGDAVVTPSGKKTTAAGAKSENSRSTSSQQSEISGKQESSRQSEASGKQESSRQSEASGKQESSQRSETSGKQESSQRSEASGKQESSRMTETSGQEQTSRTQESSKASNPSEPSVPEESSGKEDDRSEKGTMQTAVVIDGKRNDNSYCTQIVYYDAVHDELTNPLVPLRMNSNMQYSNPTQRSEAVFSRDVNGDDIIEIPMIKQMNAAVDENGASVCNQIEWSQYNAVEKKLNTVMMTVQNLKDGYYVVMPERWNGSVTARTDAETREMTFYIWTAKTSSLGDKLLTISRFTEQQWKEAGQERYIQLDIQSENRKAVFAAQLFHTNADDSLNISADELSELIYAI